MARKLLTVEDFRESAKDGGRSDAMVVRASTDPAEMVADTRRVKFVFSDGSVDRSGDSIDPSGWVLEGFNKNPVALFGHDSGNIDAVIGRAVNVGVFGKKLVGEIDFTTADVNPKADMAFRMVEAGLLSAVSVGFMPLEFGWSTDKNRPYGIDFTKQELLEISLVPVPCNGNALIQARGMGIDTGPLAEWAQRILDGEGKVSIPRPFLEEVFRAAKTPRAVRQKYLAPEARSDSPDWRVGAARDLLVDDAAAWDGAAAAARMFAAAGFDSDAPDAAQARRGFLVYDAANPSLKSSYKLPFADMVGGELKAIAEGVRSATAKLPQTDAAQSVLSDARKVLGTYDGSPKPVKQRGIAHAMEKDLDNVSWLSGILQSLSMLEDWVEWETEYEGDGSDISGRLTAVLQTLAQILLDMTAEEVSELLAEETDEMGAMALAAHTPGQKVLVGLAKATKAGRRISASNETMLQKAMDLHQQATECVKSVLDSNADPETNDVVVVEEQAPVDHVKSAERDRRVRIAQALALSLEAAV